MRITHLRSVSLAATDPEALTEFYVSRWGLARVPAQGPTVYLRGAGPENHIVRIMASDRTRLAGYSLGVPNRSAVDVAAAELTSWSGVSLVAPPAELTSPGGGYGFVVADLDGRLVEVSADVAAGAGGADGAVVRPTKISHLVINTAHADGYDRFLRDLLGFTLADQMPHMNFYRCNSDHHSIAISPAPHASLNHVAFEVPTVADVLRGIDNLAGDVPVVWGPNRHGPGDNVFAYFRAPNDQVIEYTSEVQQVDEANAPEPRMWLPQESQVVDDWAEESTLRPTPEARAAMLGAPENELVPASTV